MLNGLAENLGKWLTLRLESLLARGSDLRSLSKASKECRESEYLAEWSINASTCFCGTGLVKNAEGHHAATLTCSVKVRRNLEESAWVQRGVEAMLSCSRVEYLR